MTSQYASMRQIVHPCNHTVHCSFYRKRFTRTITKYNDTFHTAHLTSSFHFIVYIYVYHLLLEIYWNRDTFKILLQRSRSRNKHSSSESLDQDMCTYSIRAPSSADSARFLKLWHWTNLINSIFFDRYSKVVFTVRDLPSAYSLHCPAVPLRYFLSKLQES